MLNEKELECRAAIGYAAAAAMDAERRNREIASTYSEKQRAKAQTALDLIDTAYSYSRIWKNFRQKFIAIKIESPVARSRKMVREMDDIFESRGYSKVRTAQGIVYRIPRV